MKTKPLILTGTVLIVMTVLIYPYVFTALKAEELPEGLIIVTTEYIKNGSSALDEFISEKEKRGIPVKIATEKDFGGEDLKGYEKAVLIRKWLKSNYSDYSHLLLIGNPDTVYGDIPMVAGSPCGADASDPCKDTGYSCVKIPTDFYYADLTGEWDVNSDGTVLENIVDTEEGGPDFDAELATGRFPVYFDDLDELDEIIGHALEYMRTPQEKTAYRKKMLFPMSYIWFDGYKVFQTTMHENKETAETSEWFINNILPSYPDIGYTRLYEGEGYLHSAYEHELDLTRENLIDEWKNGYGMVFWGGHGLPKSVVRTVWNEDSNSDNSCQDSEASSPDLIQAEDSENVASGKPSFIVAISCLVGYVIEPGSISYTFLRDGASVGIISSSSITDPSSMTWTNMDAPLDETTIGEDNTGIIFFEELIKGTSAGKAFYKAKKELGTSLTVRVLEHKLMLNYFGDPTLTLYDCRIDDEEQDDSEVTDDEKPGDIDNIPEKDDTGSSGCSLIFF